MRAKEKKKGTARKKNFNAEQGSLVYPKRKMARQECARKKLEAQRGKRKIGIAGYGTRSLD